MGFSKRNWLIFLFELEAKVYDGVMYTLFAFRIKSNNSIKLTMEKDIKMPETAAKERE